MTAVNQVIKQVKFSKPMKRFAVDTKLISIDIPVISYLVLLRAYLKFALKFDWPWIILVF